MKTVVDEVIVSSSMRTDIRLQSGEVVSHMSHEVPLLWW
jgi:hypothetical protein